MSFPYEEKARTGLEQLGLHVASGHLDSVAQRAASEQWSYSHFLGYLLEGELDERHRKRIALNLQFARFPYLRELKGFEFDAQPGIDRRLIEELSSGRYLEEGRNVVFLGPPGVGKTHLAIALGMRVAQMGHRVYFTTAMDLAHRMTKAVDENRLHRELKYFMQPKLLILDEVGYLSFDKLQSSLLFQVICRRYQKGQSIILTSNKSFSDWGEVFSDDAVMASAALDRLLHRSTVFNIRGESYRLRGKKKAGVQVEEGVPKNKSKKGLGA